MHILGIILIGLVVGILARIVTPGPNPRGIIVTIVIGIVGAVIATYGGQALGLYHHGEAAVRRQQFRDQMVEQEALAELRRIGIEVPGARPLADRVPGPHRIRIDPVHQLDRDADPAVMAG